MAAKPVYAPPPVIEPGHTFNTVTEQIAGIVLTRRHPYSWFFGLGVGFLLTMMLLMAITWLLIKGTGIWGVNSPWALRSSRRLWIGFGHAAPVSRSTAAQTGLAYLINRFANHARSRSSRASSR